MECPTQAEKRKGGIGMGEPDRKSRREGVRKLLGRRLSQHKGRAWHVQRTAKSQCGCERGRERGREIREGQRSEQERPQRSW